MKALLRRTRTQLIFVVRKRPSWLRHGFVRLCLLALVLLAYGLMSGRQIALLVGWVFIGLVVILFVREAYTQGWAWTGFIPSSHPSKDNDVQSPKTLWDWLQLFIVPTVLAAGGLWFTQQQQMQANRSADNQAKDAVLDNYMNTMSDLLLKGGLRNAKAGAVVQEIAQARTTTAVRRLDGPRNGILLTFVSKSGINLKGADLRGADLRGADLYTAELHGTFLYEANLGGTYLAGADLYGANLYRANLGRANLAEADLTGANLRGATIEPEQLAQAKSLAGATMPDGKIHP